MNTAPSIVSKCFLNFSDVCFGFVIRHHSLSFSLTLSVLQHSDKFQVMSGDQSLVVADPRHKSVLVAGSESEYVKLNVGGTLFYTTIGTLTKCDSMLRYVLH